MEEVWRDIKGYEGLYQVSNLGRIKSLAKSWKAGLPCLRTKPETIMAQSTDGKGYIQMFLSKNGKTKSIKAHLLVWDAFGEENRSGMEKQIDHIDNDKQNNSIDNLRIVSNRVNSTKRSSLADKTSRFVGVRYRDDMKKWTAQIYYDKKRRYLGSFDCESLAGLAYQKTLISIGEL